VDAALLKLFLQIKLVVALFGARPSVFYVGLIDAGADASV
jgi:hypothetical protein